MKALQITRPGHFEILDVPPPSPFPDEVVVEVRAINSCTHWDLTVWDGIDIWGRPDHPEYPYSIGAPGHEWSGVVVEKGAQVSTVNVGDRVAYWGSPPGLKPLRPGGKEYGGYVQRVCIQERSVLPFPSDSQLSFKEMAMLEMLSCVTQGVVCAGDLTGKRVAVTGMGAAGLMMLQALKTLGPDSLTAIDVQPDRCELAVKLGADRVRVLGMVGAPPDVDPVPDGEVPVRARVDRPDLDDHLIRKRARRRNLEDFEVAGAGDLERFH